jgi:hypothetical protein
VLSRIVGIATLFTALAVTGVNGQLISGHSTTFGDGNALLAQGSAISVSYYGWEATTYFGDDIYALTGAQYATGLTDGCFQYSNTYRASCSSMAALIGVPLFGKPDTGGPSCPFPDNACYGPPSTPQVLPWTTGDEVIFALRVDKGLDDDGNPLYDWFFSGDPLRNLNWDGTDGYAHLAYFPAGPNGVDGNRGIGMVPGTVGEALYGFEDVTYESSDWDFDNAIFAVNFDATVTPEPATMTLLASGLVGMGVLSGRRRSRRKTPDA